MRYFLLISTAIVTSISLTACANVTRELRHFPELFNPRIQITEYNYGAADALVAQAKPDLTLSMPVGIGALQPTNLKHFEKTPPFGRVVADQIGSRMVQLGYHVKDLGTEIEMIGETSERAFLDAASKTGADALITGNYTISDYDVIVNVRLVGIKTGRVWGSVDYRIPLGSDTYQILGRDPFFALPIPPNNNPDGYAGTAQPVISEKLND